MADDNVYTPPWKRLQTPAARAKGESTKSMLRAIDSAMYDALDTVGAKAFFLRFINGNAGDRAAFLQFLGRRMPQQISGQLDHTLTVKIVKQVGEREIVLDMRDGPQFKNPPRDAVTGERLPVVSLPGSAPKVDPVDG